MTGVGPPLNKAARLHRPRSAEAPEDLRIDDLPTPRPGPDEVLVRVRACGVCASDLHVVQGVTPASHLPLTLGHEAAGVVAEVGADVGDWLPGDRVLVPPGRACGQCPMCVGGRDNLCPHQQVLGVDIDGAQADHVLAPGRMLVPVPGSVPFEQAAILADAVATPYHALKRGGVDEGVSCAIVGLGGLGMHAVQLAKLAGAHVVGVDVDPVCLDRALAWGADEVVDASEGGGARQVRELTGGGVDRAFEFVGLQATAHDAVKSLRAGGRATLVGIGRERLSTLPLGLFVSQELEVVGSFGSTQQDVNELLDLLEAGRLDLSRSITHRLDLEEFPEALRMLESRDGHPVRIVVAHGGPEVVDPST